MATVECLVCGHVGATKTKGSFAITIILLFIGLLPGIIYEIWRRSGGKVCGACGGNHVKLYIPPQRVVQQPINYISQAEPTKVHNKTKLVVEDTFSYNIMQNKNSTQSEDEALKLALRQRNQAFINRSKKRGFNFAKLLFIALALTLGLVVGLAASNRDTSYNQPIQSAAVERGTQINTDAAPKEVEVNNSYSPSSTSVNSSFQQCKSKAQATQLSVAGTQYKSTVIIDADDSYMARVCTNDGSVLITCSGHDGKMILTKSEVCP